MTSDQENITTSSGSDSKSGDGNGGALSGGPGGAVFKPDTGRDAKGTGSHQSGEGGSGNESGPEDAEQPDGTSRAPLHPS
jgi:hypothetical protein